jgi:hypothetical protein
VFPSGGAFRVRFDSGGWAVLFISDVTCILHPRELSVTVPCSVRHESFSLSFTRISTHFTSLDSIPPGHVRLFLYTYRNYPDALLKPAKFLQYLGWSIFAFQEL